MSIKTKPLQSKVANVPDRIYSMLTAAKELVQVYENSLETAIVDGRLEEHKKDIHGFCNEAYDLAADLIEVDEALADGQHLPDRWKDSKPYPRHKEAIKYKGATYIKV